MDAALLAQLDDAPTAALDPGLWPANLAALHECTPSLAEQLAQLVLPAHWRPATALDESPTFRLEPPGEPAIWLAGTAIPRTRAQSLLTAFDAGEHNPLLSTIAAGAELTLLLERLPIHRAVYVFESDPMVLAAVLRILDLSAALRTGRCIFVPPPREAEFLKELLTANPGLLPPGNILRLPHVTGSRLDELRTLGETVYRETRQARLKRLRDATDSSIQTSQPCANKPRLALLALTPDRRPHLCSMILERAAGALGWPVLRCVFDSPRHADLTTHTHTLADFAPHLTLSMDPPRAQPSWSRPGVVCEWHWRAYDLSEQLPMNATLHLAASPRIAAALRTAGVLDDRIVEFFWACDPDEELSAMETPPIPDAQSGLQTVLLIGDLPDDNPAVWGIDQPTHKNLWRQLRQTITEAWETRDLLYPEALLIRAERAARAGLGEAGLRTRMLKLIEHVLIPAVVQERIKRALECEPIRIFTLGKGWNRLASEQLRPWAEEFFGLPATGKASPQTAPTTILPARPLAAIFTGVADPLAPTLLQAGLRGWPLLLHSPDSASATRLGQILCPEQHFQPFATQKELRTALQMFRDRPRLIVERAARTQAHLRENHSYSRRLAALAQRLFPAFRS